MLIVRGRRIVLPDGERPAVIRVDNGRVLAIEPFEARMPDSADLVEAGDLVVSPGIVDSHVHANEPGRTEWEGFESVTRAGSLA